MRIPSVSSQSSAFAFQQSAKLSAKATAAADKLLQDAVAPTTVDQSAAGKLENGPARTKEAEKLSDKAPLPSIEAPRGIAASTPPSVENPAPTSIGAPTAPLPTNAIRAETRGNGENPQRDQENPQNVEQNRPIEARQTANESNAGGGNTAQAAAIAAYLKILSS